MEFKVGDKVRDVRFRDLGEIFAIKKEFTYPIYVRFIDRYGAKFVRIYSLDGISRATQEKVLTHYRGKV